MVNKIIQTTVKPPSRELPTAEEKAAYVVMRLPWIGAASRRFKTEIEETITKGLRCSKLPTSINFANAEFSVRNADEFCGVRNVD